LHPQPVFVRFGGFDQDDGPGGIISEGFKGRRHFPSGLADKPLQPEPVRFSILYQAGRQGERFQNIFPGLSVNAFHNDFHRAGGQDDDGRPRRGQKAQKEKNAAPGSEGRRGRRTRRMGKGHDLDGFLMVFYSTFSVAVFLP
jgi:hypothetical protein